MTVDELRQALADIPGDTPVYFIDHQEQILHNTCVSDTTRVFVETPTFSVDWCSPSFVSTQDPNNLTTAFCLES